MATLQEYLNSLARDGITFNREPEELPFIEIGGGEDAWSIGDILVSTGRSELEVVQLTKILQYNSGGENYTVVLAKDLKKPDEEEQSVRLFGFSLASDYVVRLKETIHRDLNRYDEIMRFLENENHDD